MIPEGLPARFWSAHGTTAEASGYRARALLREQEDDFDFRESLLAELEEAFGPMRCSVRPGPDGLEHRPSVDSCVYLVDRVVDEFRQARKREAAAAREAEWERQRREREKRADELRGQEEQVWGRALRPWEMFGGWRWPP